MAEIYPQFSDDLFSVVTVTFNPLSRPILVVTFKFVSMGPLLSPFW